MAFKKGALAGITRKNSPEGFDMSKSTALIIGVGAATGAAVCRALADRYRLLMVARSGAVISELAYALRDQRKVNHLPGKSYLSSARPPQEAGVFRALPGHTKYPKSADHRYR